MRDTLLIIHILAAGTWIGGSLTVLFLNRRLRKSGREAGAAFMSGYGEMGRKYFPPAAVLLLLTGILLVIDSDVFEFENAFVAIGIVVVIAGALLGSLVFDPISKEARRAHQDADAAAEDAAYRRFGRVGLLDISLLVLAVVAMVMKWGV